jgi:putative nucleotidyltransferase with HDIG domain
MPISATGVGDPAAQKQVREYFREVSERCKLPPLPAVVASALRMIRSADIDTRQLARVLSNDAALVGRLFTVSRSAFYGRYSPPKTLPQALQVLGLRTVQRILVAATAQALCRNRSEISDALWSHSLAVALTAEILARQAGLHELESAFLGGLLHDIGQMVLLNGDPVGFGKLVQQMQQGEKSVSQGEKELYGSDHTLIGMVLMDCWDFDGEIGKALLHHHDDTITAQEPASLAALLRVADYLSGLTGFTLVAEPPPPTEVLVQWGCADEEVIPPLLERIRQAFENEKALYT